MAKRSAREIEKEILFLLHELYGGWCAYKCRLSA